MNETTPEQLGDLMEKGHRVFWLLDFNTQDWILSRMLGSDKVVRLDTTYQYDADDIKSCPALPVEKPQPLKRSTIASDKIMAVKAIEGAWVIEHHGSPAHSPNYFAGWNDGGKEWHTDNLKAIRFSREQDARTVSELLEHLEDSWRRNRVAYHEWG